MYCLFCRVPVFPVVAAALRLSCAQQKRRWLCGLGTLWWTTVPFAAALLHMSPQQHRQHRSSSGSVE